MKTNEPSPFYSPRVQRHLTPELIKPAELKSWLRKQKSANKTYFKKPPPSKNLKSLLNPKWREQKLKRLLLGRTLNT